MKKNIRIFIWKLSVFGGEAFSIYLNSFFRNDNIINMESHTSKTFKLSFKKRSAIYIATSKVWSNRNKFKLLFIYSFIYFFTYLFIYTFFLFFAVYWETHTCCTSSWNECPNWSKSVLFLTTDILYRHNRYLYILERTSSISRICTVKSQGNGIHSVEIPPCLTREANFVTSCWLFLHSKPLLKMSLL